LKEDSTVSVQAPPAVAGGESSNTVPTPDGILLEEISNPPCPYFEGTFEPSFFPSHVRPFTDRKTDISVFKEMLNNMPEKV
jgi:hypothetical protein